MVCKSLLKLKLSNDVGFKVNEETNELQTVCECNHLTLFASNWIVPPNTIDFSTVFDDVGAKIVDNIHVIVMIIIVLMVYIVMVVVFRRLDKTDESKV